MTSPPDADTRSESDEEQVSWMAIRAHCPVIASDGQEVGVVLEVAALPEEDIFHGVVFQHKGHGRTYMALAADIKRTTTRAVYLSVDSAQAASYEEFHELHVSRVGVRGIFGWKHLGWKDSSE